MPTLVWSEQVALDHPQMDATHQEFVRLLADAEAALATSCAQALARYDELVEHTVSHFEQEDRWMKATGFAAENCHSGHHAQVLALLREVSRHAHELSDFGPLTRMIPELASWFVNHAQTMDTMLAMHLAAVGFDPASGRIERPVDATAPMTGCGGACATHEQEPSCP